MKNIFLAALCFTRLLTVSSQAWSSVVTYAEVNFGCNGETPDYSASPALNVADATGEFRVIGLGSARLSLDGLNLILTTEDQTVLILGSLTALPTCEVEDTGEAATASWNAVMPSSGVALNLIHAAQTTLVVTDLQTQKVYSF